MKKYRKSKRSKRKYNRRRNPARTRHLPSCDASHMTFGGHCLNCGLGAPPRGKKPSRASRIAHLKTMGFKFPRNKKRNPSDAYDQLAIIPALVAETVTERPYTGREISTRNRDSRLVERVEGQRRNMSRDTQRAFVRWVDAKCRAAYKAKAPWFMKIARSKTNTGRNQLYAFVSHWLAAYLTGGRR